MNLLSKVVMFFVAALVAAPALAAEPEILCELGRRQIYLGESVVYQVTLNHVENPSAPKLEGFDDFDVTPMGPKNLDERHISVDFSGKTTEIIRRGRAYQYRLTPRRAGRLMVPAPVAEVDGQMLRGRELTLRVMEADSQDVVVMKITSDPSSVFPTQRMTVRLSVWVRALPGSLAGRNPLSVLPRPPVLQIPWVDDRHLPEGLVPVEDAQVWLSQLRDLGRGGFSINNLVDSSISSMLSMFDHRVLKFQPDPRRVTRVDSDGKEADYWLYEFDREFVAQRAGKYALGPVTLQGTFATNEDLTGQLTGEKIYAVAPRVEVDVKQVPEVGRPASYLGAIGQFTWTADMKPEKCRVGDPITLTLTLRGRGSLAAAAAPDLAELPQVAANFKTYEGTREVKGDTCRFTYTLRPLNEVITEFPPIPGSYFDVAAERYVTLQTEPIPIEVEKAAELADRQIIGGSSAARKSGELETRREGICVNITNRDELGNQAVHVEYWVAGLGGLAGLYGLVAFGTWFVRRRISDPALTRRRAAVSRARRRLNDATTLLKSRDTQRGAEQLRGALVGLVADVADAAEAGMTSADACRRLRHFGVEVPVVDRLGKALEACDATRYTPTGADTNGLAHEADELFDSVVQSLKKQRCLR